MNSGTGLPILIGWALVEQGIGEMQAKHRNYISTKYIVLDRQSKQYPAGDVATVCELVKEKQGVAVCFLSDIFLTGPEETKHRNAAKLRIVKRREAIVCQVSTPLETKWLMQFYRSTCNGIVPEERRSEDISSEEGDIMVFF